jgi:hypothetical protein
MSGDFPGGRLEAFGAGPEFRSPGLHPGDRLMTANHGHPYQLSAIISSIFVIKERWFTS